MQQTRDINHYPHCSNLVLNTYTVVPGELAWRVNRTATTVDDISKDVNEHSKTGKWNLSRETVGGDTVTLPQSKHKYLLLQVTVVYSIPMQHKTKTIGMTLPTVDELYETYMMKKQGTS